VNHNLADYKWQQNKALYILVWVIKGILLMLQEKRQNYLLADGERWCAMVRDGGGWCVMVRSGAQHRNDMTWHRLFL
jgi:hypothetical protein